MGRRIHDGILNEPILTKSNFALLCMVAAVYVFTFYIRMNFGSELAYINVPYYFSLVVMLVGFRGRCSLGGIAGCVVLTVIYFVTEISVGTGAKDILKFFFLYCAPLFVCQLWFGRTHCERVQFARVIIRMVNAFVIFVFIVLVADCLSGSAVMRALTSTFMRNASSWVPSNVMDRHPSIWGHYLITAGFYMTFYFLNVAYFKTENEWLINVRLLYVVATIGVLSTGGKTAFVLYLTAIIWLNLTGSHKVRNALVLTVFLIILYLLGLFDVVLARFDVEDLSSGRNEAAGALLRAESVPLFGGYGEGFMARMATHVGSYTVSIATEYSFLALAYKYGILFVVLMVALMMRGPVLAAFDTGEWSLSLMAALLVLYFSTFNAFYGIPDSYLVFSLYALVINLLRPELEEAARE